MWFSCGVFFSHDLCRADFYVSKFKSFRLIVWASQPLKNVCLECKLVPSLGFQSCLLLIISSYWSTFHVCSSRHVHVPAHGSLIRSMGQIMILYWNAIRFHLFCGWALTWNAQRERIPTPRLVESTHTLWRCTHMQMHTWNHHIFQMDSNYSFFLFFL